jgi:hypothetical protein
MARFVQEHYLPALATYYNEIKYAECYRKRLG